MGVGNGLQQADVPTGRRAAPRPRGYRTIGQGQGLVVNHQVRVNLQPVTKAGALGTGAVGAVEAESARLYFDQAGAAVNAGELLGKGQVVPALHHGLDHAVSFPYGGLHRLGHPADLHILPDDEPVHHDFDVVPLALVQVQVTHLVQQVDRAVDPHSDESRLACSLENVLVFTFLTPHLGGQQQDSAAFRQPHDGAGYLLHRLPFHWTVALGAVGRANAGEQQPHVVVNLGYRANGGPGIVGHPFLVDGYGRRQALDVINIGLVHPAQELPGVCR